MARRYGRNTYIKILREFGVTDKQRKQMREIMREYETNNVFERIAQRNFEVFGEEIWVAPLSYETAYRYMLYTGKSFDEILQEYRKHKELIERGETTETIDFITKTTNELQDMGIDVKYEKTAELMQNEDTLFDLIHYKERYNYYKMIGDAEGMRFTIVQLKELYGLYQK